MSYWTGKRKDEAEEAVKKLLTKFVSGEEALSFLEIINEYVDAKIEHAVGDLDDRINKTGVWDPDY